MSPRPAELIRSRRAGWPLAALLALAPKCFLCLAAYTGSGALLGIGGPEFCGAASEAALPWPEALAAAGAMLGLGRLAVTRCRPTAAGGAN